MKIEKMCLNICVLVLAVTLIFAQTTPLWAQDGPASLGASMDIAIDETNFPDENFRGWLTDSGSIGGAGSDGILTQEEIEGVKLIYMARLGIRDLTGIERFTSLEYLQCAYNFVPFTAPMGLPDSLKGLYFMGSELTELPNLPAGLEALNCSDNRLAELPPLPDSLKGLDCSNNFLTELDLTELDDLDPAAPTAFKADGQTAYIALFSDGAGGFEAPFDLRNPTFGESAISYAGGMLKSNSSAITEITFTVETGKAGASLSGTLHLSYPAVGSIEINAANFPDPKFRAILKSPDIWTGIRGAGKDGYLTPEEIAGIQSLDVNNQGIGNLKGIEQFSALETLNCSQNALTALPALPGSLKTLLCSSNRLTSLPILPDGLIGLDCSYNPLAAPPSLPDGLKWLSCAGLGDVLPPALPATLIELDYSDNGLTSLPVLPDGLEVLNCSGNLLTVLDLSGFTALEQLDCSGNHLTALDLSSFSAAGYFDLQADDQTPALSLTGSDAAGYSAPVSLNNPSGLAAGITYTEGILKSTGKPITTTPFSVDTGLAGKTLSGTMMLTYENGGASPGGPSSGGSGSVTAPEKKSDQPITAVISVTAAPGANGTASVSIPERVLNDAITKAQAGARSQSGAENEIAVTLNVTMPQGATSLTLTLTQGSLQDLTKVGVVSFATNSVPVNISFNLEALREIQRQSTGDVTITFSPAQNLTGEARELIGSRPAYNITIRSMKDSKAVNIISLGGGTATLSIPYTPGRNEAIGFLFGVYAEENGKAARIAGSAYDGDAGAVLIPTGHFSAYGVGYTSPIAKFTDIGNHWGRESIDFAVGRGLLSGTSDTTFSPNAVMTRGMLVTALGRLASVDVKGYTTSSFTDVKASTAFQPYIEWAYKNGIVQGTGDNRFAPDRAVTREEIAVIFANYAKSSGYTLPMIRGATDYADASGIEDAYKSAVVSMQQAGIMMGDSGNQFHPKSDATRAEIATMLYRYIGI